jgi:hypothetical protein
MRYISFLIALLSTGAVWSQSLDVANDHFDRYEYALAAKSYRAYRKTAPLPKEDLKRYAYSCFVIGSYEECLPISDSIIKMSDTEPFFYYMNGEVNMGNRNYEKAKSSYETYQSMDSEYDVSIKIESCASIPNWNQEVHLENELLTRNTTKANITGPNYLDGILFYSEIGKDSLGENMQNGNIDNSELVLARPFTLLPNEEAKQILLIDTIGDVSVPSVAFDKTTMTAFVTIAQPLAEGQMDMVPHLYVGNYSDETQEISDLKPWLYSGYEDSSACAHATINESGNMLVFTKMGERTSGADLYKSDLVDGEWTKPQSIIGLNTKMDEMYPLFIGDSLLSFATDGRPGYGGLDIFIADVSDAGKFGFVRHLKSPVNSFMDDFNFYYYSADSARYTSNRKGGTGDDDMYFVKFSEPEVPVADSSDFHEFVKDWETPIVYFDFDKFNLKEDVEKLSDLITFLGKYPKSSITIEGHTDRRGSTDYNYNLGYKRAETVKAELIRKGISAGQISVKSKGESEPQVNCEPCTELMHAKNRVALIKLNAK